MLNSIYENKTRKIYFCSPLLPLVEWNLLRYCEPMTILKCKLSCGLLKVMTERCSRVKKGFGKKRLQNPSPLHILDTFFTSCILHKDMCGCPSVLMLHLSVKQKLVVSYIRVATCFYCKEREIVNYIFILSQFKVDQKVLKYSNLHFIFKLIVNIQSS